MEPATPSRLVVLCDFDGTLVDIDTCVYLLNQFVEDWRRYDEQLEREEITLEECLQKQFSTVQTSKEQMLDAVQRVTSIRPRFAALVEHCRNNRVALIVVSAGLDFVISYFLKREQWDTYIKTRAPKSKCTTKGIKLTFPKLLDNTAVNLKDDLVRLYQRKGREVVFIGDGLADFHAAKISDHTCAIKGSKLAELLMRNEIQHREINCFQEVVELLRSIQEALDNSL